MASPTPEDLRAYVNGSATDDGFISACLEQAEALVTQAVGGATVPEQIGHRAVLEVGSELYHRRQAPSGISQFATADGTPMRVARDPMVAARALLAPYLKAGLA